MVECQKQKKRDIGVILCWLQISTFFKIKNIMNVLSVFDGLSCGQIALNRVGIKYDKYFASEVDKHAIKVTQHNYPNTIQLGDVTKVKGPDLPKIDLLFGGSPCQGFSFAGKQLNFDDPRSKLFFEFVRLKNELQPKYFLLENVVMKQEFQDVITEYLGVEPIKINSNLVSAQTRERLYWTNIPNINQPEDLGITLNDILEDIGVNGEVFDRTKLNKATILGRRLNEQGKRDDYNKNIPISQCLEVRASNRDKSNCITTVAKDNVLTTMPIGRHVDAFKKKLPFRYYTIKEYCRLQTVPDDYFDGVASENQIRKMIGNGWTVDVIAHIFKEIKEL
jgi:DNA (cytosine-5)-methyltransferase 3A